MAQLDTGVARYLAELVAPIASLAGYQKRVSGI